MQAGFRHPCAMSWFLAIKLIAAFVLPLLVVLPLLMLGLLSDKAVIAVALLTVLGLLEFFGPDIFPHHRIEERQNTISGSFPDALDMLVVFDQVLARDVADRDAQEGRGLALLNLGRLEAAGEQLAAVMASSRQRWRSLNGLGLVLDMQGQSVAAQQHYREAAALQPGHPLILNNMGYSRMMAQDYAAAEALFREGLRAAPDGAYLQSNLVLAIAWQGEYGRALVEAMRRQPREEALNNIGYIALLKKDYRAAISYFEQALEASPRWYPRAASNLERAKQEAAAAQSTASE